jgi:Outer membrane protein beta-barrel family/CarboxypepD_reg-like domain
MKTLLTIIACLFFYKTAISQTISIAGTVKDVGNEFMPGATVRLLKAADSTLVKGEISNGNGKFQFNNLQENNYIITISSMGYKLYKSVILKLDGSQKNIQLPVIILLPEKNKELKEVIVTAQKPLLEQDIDKTIVNVESMISAATSNTLEVLEKTPGITVSNDGEISLNGKAGVLVLIDGRPTYMSGADLATYLRSLPGGLLDKIELMDNPPAKYDASGSAIINIRLKKNKIGGFTGSLSKAFSQGVYGKTNGTLNLNYLYKKINVFTNLGYNFDKGYSFDLNNRKFYSTENQLVSSINLENDNKFSRKGRIARLGLDYVFSPQTTFGFLLGFDRNNKNGTIDFASNGYKNNDLESIGLGQSFGGFKRTNLNTNLNFSHKFKKQGEEISADVNYLRYQSPFEWNVNNNLFQVDENITTKTQLYFEIPNDINIYTAKVDYVHPLKNKSLWEIGVKSSIVNNDNDPKYYTVEGGINVPDYTKTNHFLYHENLNAGYFNTRKSWKRLGLQLGLRVENTNVEGNQIGNAIVAGTTFSRSYTGLFPTAFLSYKLDSLGNNTLNISLSRRISRPNYQALNPFVEYLDLYSRNMGNPMLSPQYQYRFDVNFQHKRSFGIGFQMGRFEDVIFQSSTEAVGELYITRPINIPTGFMYILSSNLSQNPAKWWTINGNLQLAYMGLKGIIYSQILNQTTTAIRLNILNQFTLKKGWSAEISGFYMSREIQSQTIINPRYRVFVAAQKKILKDKGTIKLSAEDIFHSWTQTSNTVSIKQSTSYSFNEGDTQRLGIAFTYRFGKDTFARKRKYNSNGADSESERAN